jgi:hypothetical protein
MTRISYNSERVEARVEAIDKLMELRDPAAVAATARELGLQWFLLEPGTQVNWPEAIVNRPAFELGGYRLYQF